MNEQKSKGNNSPNIIGDSNHVNNKTKTYKEGFISGIIVGIIAGVATGFILKYFGIS